MDTLEQGSWEPEPEPNPHFRQELIPHGHVWPSGVVLPPHELDLYNLYTTSMNAQVHNAELWPILFKDRSLFLTAMLQEAEAERAKSNPMALLRRAVDAQNALWDVLGELERLFDIEDDDKAGDQLADEIKDFACNGRGDRIGVSELMQFIDAMGSRRKSDPGYAPPLAAFPEAAAREGASA